MQTTDQQLSDIYEEVGPAEMFRLGREPALGEAGAQFTRQVIAAANRGAQDPEKLRRLVEPLTSESRDERLAAAHKMATGREQAAIVLLQAITDPDQPHTERLQFAWRFMGDSALPPLLGALRSEDDQLRSAALRALGLIRSQKSRPQIIGLAAGTQDPLLRQTAQQTLHKLDGSAGLPADADRYLEREVMQRLALSDSQAGIDSTEQLVPLTFWYWTSHDQPPQRRVFPRRTAQLIEANRLAHDLQSFRTDYRPLFLVTELALSNALSRDGRAAERQQPQVASLQQRFDPQEVSAALDWAITNQVPEAAIAATQVLGAFGDENVLHLQAASPSPLSAAMRSDHRALRHAAAAAIMQIHPLTPFNGASDLIELAVAMATTSGGRRALVIHPVEAEAGDVAGLLGAQQWEADPVNSGRQAADKLVNSADYELILLSDATVQPRFTELLQQLRGERHSRGIPLAIISRRLDLRSIDQLTARWPEVRVFPFPYDADGLSVILDRTPRKPYSTIAPQLRQRHAQEALRWLAEVASQPEQLSFYELPRHDRALAAALWRPDLAADAAAVLGNLGTPAAQTALVQAIQLYSADTPTGQAVRAALAKATQRRGVLLTLPRTGQSSDR
jgi:HEAT repeat protein